MCNLCTKSFASQKTLKRHRQTVHRQSGGFACRVCQQRFYRTDNLRKHHISKHGDEAYEAPASYRCPVCEKSFHYHGHLTEHLKTHPAATSSPPTAPASSWAPAAPMHEGVRPSYRPAYPRIVGSVIGTIGLKSGQVNGAANASECTLSDWRRLVTLPTCCGPSSAPKKMHSRSTWRLALF